MKIKQLIWIIAWASCYAGIVYAETVSGTVTSIDATGQNVTLRRADTNATMTLHVTDKTSLDTLTTGRQVSLDANKTGNVWEAQSFSASPDTVLHPMISTGTDVNATSGINATSPALTPTGLNNSSGNPIAPNRTGANTGFASNAPGNMNNSSAVSASTGSMNSSIGSSGK